CQNWNNGCLAVFYIGNFYRIILITNIDVFLFMFGICQLYSNTTCPYSLNQFSLILLLSLLGLGDASRTLNMVGRFTACPKINACCVGIEGILFNIASEI